MFKSLQQGVGLLVRKVGEGSGDSRVSESISNLVQTEFQLGDLSACVLPAMFGKKTRIFECDIG
jgi:hypothetical protein